MIRRPDHRSAAAALAVRLIVGGLLALLGCAGGSGSSGFDLAENGAIMQALDEERCVESDGLTICPADGSEASSTPTPTGTPVVEPTVDTPTSPPNFETPTATPPGEDTLTPTPPLGKPSTTMTPSENSETRTPTPTGPSDNRTATPTRTLPQPTVPSTATRTPSRVPTPTRTMAGPADMRIDTQFGEARAVDCVPDGSVCSFTFAFSPQGFPPDTTFQVAARLRDPDGEWLLFPADEVSFDPSMPVFEAFIILKLENRREEDLVAQIAVLVFSDAAAAPGPAVDSLGASGANFAFVTGEVTVILEQ